MCGFASGFGGYLGFCVLICRPCYYTLGFGLFLSFCVLGSFRVVVFEFAFG